MRSITGNGPLVDDVLPHDDDAGHVVGPVLARVEEHAPEAAQLRLRRERLAHRKRVDRVCGERATGRIDANAGLEREALLLVAGLPRAPRGKAYEVWVIEGKTPKRADRR